MTRVRHFPDEGTCYAGHFRPCLFTIISSHNEACVTFPICQELRQTLNLPVSICFLSQNIAWTRFVPTPLLESLRSSVVAEFTNLRTMNVRMQCLRFPQRVIFQMQPAVLHHCQLIRSSMHREQRQSPIHEHPSHERDGSSRLQ